MVDTGSNFGVYFEVARKEKILVFFRWSLVKAEEGKALMNNKAEKGVFVRKESIRI